jgi:hypothetical protein
MNCSDPKKVLEEYENYCEKNGMRYQFLEGRTMAEMEKELGVESSDAGSVVSGVSGVSAESGEAVHLQQFISKDGPNGCIVIRGSNFVLSVATLHDFLDSEERFLTSSVNGSDVEDKGTDSTYTRYEELDYIHGLDVIEKLVSAENSKSCGFVCPTIHKSDLFKTIMRNGELPRKTFSMGHAEDKRFYLESRKIC